MFVVFSGMMVIIGVELDECWLVGCFCIGFKLMVFGMCVVLGVRQYVMGEIFLWGDYICVDVMILFMVVVFVVLMYGFL